MNFYKKTPFVLFRRKKRIEEYGRDRPVESLFRHLRRVGEWVYLLFYLGGAYL